MRRGLVKRGLDGAGAGREGKGREGLAGLNRGSPGMLSN